jgi:hypothetical protein
MTKTRTTKAHEMFFALLLSVITCTMLPASWGDEENEEAKLFSFGLVADVQYGDKDTRGAGHYREALGRLEECVAELNQHDLVFTRELGEGPAREISSRASQGKRSGGIQIAAHLEFLGNLLEAEKVFCVIRCPVNQKLNQNAVRGAIR